MSYIRFYLVLLGTQNEKQKNRKFFTLLKMGIFIVNSDFRLKLKKKDRIFKNFSITLLLEKFK